MKSRCLLQHKCCSDFLSGGKEEEMNSHLVSEDLIHAIEIEENSCQQSFPSANMTFMYLYSLLRECRRTRTGGMGMKKVNNQATDRHW